MRLLTTPLICRLFLRVGGKLQEGATNNKQFQATYVMAEGNYPIALIPFTRLTPTTCSALSCAIDDALDAFKAMAIAKQPENDRWPRLVEKGRCARFIWYD